MKCSVLVRWTKEITKNLYVHNTLFSMSRVFLFRLLVQRVNGISIIISMCKRY